MKPLQNHFTTPKQSKRLLELGVPANSADCYYVDKDYVRQPQFLLPNETYTSWTNEYTNPSPCWSVGRLIEIAHICSESTLSHKEEANEIQKFKEEHKCETLIEAVIMCIEDAHSVGSIDFSKLEE